MSLTFIKTPENFTCEHCGAAVIGDGYTNHCPECLWSKHVDIHPGDRASTCLGMMKPEKIEMEKGEFIITHKCLKCGYEKRNKAALKDKLDNIFGK